MLILTVHVDDVAVAGLRDEIDKLLVVLKENFTTNDLGELSLRDGYFRRNWRRVELA